jgi:hypothetical protein
MTDRNQVDEGDRRGEHLAQNSRLEYWKQLAQIMSAIAIPVVIALIGYYVQRSLADAGLKKDYVQMALGVLKEQPTRDNEQLRQWAITVLDKSSPVPIPAVLKSRLVTSSILDQFKDILDPTKWTVTCKPVPNPQTLEWLLHDNPTRYTRCPNGQVGERQPPEFMKRTPKDDHAIVVQ